MARPPKLFMYIYKLTSIEHRVLQIWEYQPIKGSDKMRDLKFKTHLIRDLRPSQI